MISEQAEAKCASIDEQPITTSADTPGGRVVLALREHEWPKASLRRAAVLSERMGAELHVVRVMPWASASPLSLRSFDTSDAARAILRMQELRRATEAWLTECLGRVAPKLAMKRGDFVDAVLDEAFELDATMIVVAPHQEVLVSSVEAIAEASGLPVLVAYDRGEQEQGEPVIVAATDLREPAFPVLRRAGELAELLGARVVPLHNVSPAVELASRAVRRPSLIRERSTVLADVKTERGRGLASAVEGLPLEGEPVVSAEDLASEAILQEARAREADLLVIGLRPRSWLSKLMSPSVASQVVRNARRSVLITPLGRSTIEQRA